MSTEKQQTFSSTKDLKRTLGKKELMGIAVGQIIGAGIMSMMGVAIAMTGRSANLAFMLSAVFTMCTFFPSIFITSCIRMRGGMYTQMAIFAGDKWAGYYSVVYFITNMSLAMYALSFAQYAIALLPSGGSDFHGKNKPDIYLGSGKNNLAIPYAFWENLKKRTHR